MTLIEAAKNYYAAGLSVIPIGEKKTPSGKWKEAQYKLIEPTNNFDKAEGIGIVCGAVSGNFYCIDFDLKYDEKGTDTWVAFKSILTPEQKNVLRRCLVESTPNRGRHVIYRVDGVYGGNEKLAKRPATREELLLIPKEKVKCFIESRGTGGYVQVYPTKGYELLNGSFDALPVLTQEEHDGLINACKSLSKEVKKKEELKPIAQQPKRFGISPFDDYNERGDVVDLLERHGWQYVEKGGQNLRFKRPGTTESRTSADWHEELRLLHVFTSSTEFEPSKSYNACQVFTMLEYGCLNKDTYREAAKKLLEMGYGEKVEDTDVDKQVELQETGNYLADDDEIDTFLEDARNGRIAMGVGIGISDLDSKWVYKTGTFNVIGGLANIGKTDSMIWWFTMLSLKHDFNWMVYSGENKEGEIIKMVIEFKCAKKIQDIPQDKYVAAKEWAKEHFTIFTNKRTYTYKEVLESAKDNMRGKAYAGLLIDPLSSLEMDVQELKLYGSYQYHYRSATQMRLFVAKTGCSLYVSMHPNTEANKRMKDGFQEAPYAADLEFGAMWQNRCDNSVTLHRRINHATEWMITEWHVRKIKSKYSGGDITTEPIRMRREVNCYYTDQWGNSPVQYERELRRYSEQVDEDDEGAPF